VPPEDLPLVLLFEVPPVSDADREDLAQDRYKVRGTTLDLVPPVDWQMDPHENVSWRFWFHTLQFLDVPLRIYEQEWDLEALAKARDLALDWVVGNPIGGERTGDYAWYDMSTGMRAAFLGYLWRECRRTDLLESGQESDLTAALRVHARWLSDQENYKPETNHGLFEDAGLYLLGAYAAELPESAGWREFAEQRFLETLERHVQFDEGVHKEHSPGYHFYIRDVVKLLNEEAGIGGERLGELVRKLDAAAGWMVLPDGTKTPFGDTDMTEAPAFAKAAAGEDGLRAFLETGYAFARRNGSYLGLTCCYHTYAHKQADELSWCLFDNGCLVVGEASRYGYRDEEDPARIYARASHGHNVLIVDDESFPWRKRTRYGSGLLAAGEGEGWYAFLGRNPLLEAVDHRRLFLYRPGELVLIVDQVEADEVHTIDRRLHFGPDLVAGNSNGAIVAKDEDDDVLATLVEGSDVPVEISLARGVEEPRLDGWTFPRDLTKVPSDAVTLRSRITSGILVHGVALTASVPARVSARRPSRARRLLRRVRRAGDDRFIIEISGKQGSSEIRVTQSGRDLIVESVDPARPGRS
jgi:Heparinase II/III-like protein/Heparinase II/III N-terminus